MYNFLKGDRKLFPLTHVKMTYTLDVEMFISEVRKYPAIWDMNDPDHRFMKKKQEAWAAIAKMFISDFEDLTEPEKVEVYRKLQSKWRNIRDSFIRNAKRNSGKGYMYAKHMAFLKDHINKTHQTSDTEEQASWSEEDGGTKKTRYKTRNIDLAEAWHEDEETSSTIDNLRRKRSLQDVIEYVETPLLADATSSAEDEDRSFFDSLLPAVRKFNMDQKLEFRSEVILLIKNIRSNKRFKAEQSFEVNFESH